MDVSNMFGYGEVNAYSRYSTLMTTYKKIENPKFRHYVLKENRDVYYALKSFFQNKYGGIRLMEIKSASLCN